MTPTPRLRFVNREEGYELYEMHGSEPCYRPRLVRVLQQWYAWSITYPLDEGEWKDVPLEKE